MDVMRARQSVDLTAQNDPTLSHRRSVSHVNPGHGRRPSQSLGGAATLELTQAQAANQAQGGDSNPVALVNQIAAANNVNVNGNPNGASNEMLPNGPIDPSKVGPGGMMGPGGYMSNGRTNDLNQVMQGFAGMQLNGNNIPPAQQQQQQQQAGMNSNLGGGYGMNGMGAMNGGGPMRRGRMSTGPGPTTGVYPYSHIGMNGKVPGVNGMVSI